METVIGVSRAWGRRDGTTELASEVDGEDCPDCNAHAGELCVNSFTGNHTRIPHPRRLRAAHRRGPIGGCPQRVEADVVDERLSRRWADSA